MEFSISLFEFDLLWRRGFHLFLNFTILEFDFGGDDARSMFCIYVDEDVTVFELVGIVLYRKNRG